MRLPGLSYWIVLPLLTATLFLRLFLGWNDVPDHTNLLMIVTDNQSPSLLGTYGNREIRTPHIDRLASEGIQFDRAYAASGVCSPTRATLMTGLLPSQTGIHVALPGTTDVSDWCAIEEFRTLPRTLSDAGFRTGLVGKYHLGNHDRPQLGFDYWVTFPSGHTTSFYDVEVIDNGKRYIVDDHLTHFWTRRAVDFIVSQNKEQPFFLLLTYNGPYMLPPTVTMQPRGPYAEYYREHPPTLPQEPVHPFLRNWAVESSPSMRMIEEGTTAWTAIHALNNRLSIINTAAETTLVDEGVGKVLQALEEHGFKENTLVVFTSDQGASYGQHGLWGNTSWSWPFAAYNTNMQVPLIFRHPTRIPGGTRTSEMVNQFDFFPTILEFLGLDKEIKGSPGKSYADLLEGQSWEHKNDVFFEFVTVRVIQTDEWKYLKRFPDTAPRELYRLSDDPEERNNLIDEPSFSHLIQELDQKLTAFFDRYADPRFDLWKGGTAKGRLLGEHYGKNDLFRNHFPNWKGPFIEKAIPFQEASPQP